MLVNFRKKEFEKQIKVITVNYVLPPNYQPNKLKCFRVQFKQMDCVILLMLFDERWVFGLRPPIFEQMLIFPIFFNLALAIVTVIDLVLNSCASEQTLIEVLGLKIFLIGIEVAMYTKLMLKRNKVIYFITKRSEHLPINNVKKITNFYREFEARKLIWGWMGFSIFAASLTLFFINLVYSLRSCTIFGPKIFFYLNLTFWMYIVMMLIGFFVSKGLFLLSAWKCPKAFLKTQKIQTTKSTSAQI